MDRPELGSNFVKGHGLGLGPRSIWTLGAFGEILALTLNIIGLATLDSFCQNSQREMLNGGTGFTNGNADQDTSSSNFGNRFSSNTAFLLDGIWDPRPAAQAGGQTFT